MGYKEKERVGFILSAKEDVRTSPKQSDLIIKLRKMAKSCGKHVTDTIAISPSLFSGQHSSDS